MRMSDLVLSWLIILVSLGILVAMIIYGTVCSRREKQRIKQERAAADAWMQQQLEIGTPLKLICRNITPNLLTSDEQLWALVPVTLREARPVHTGAFVGVGMQVTSNLGVGGGTYTGTTYDKLQNSDFGTLLLTDRRLLFLGRMHTTEINLGTIVHIDTYTDGIGVHSSDQQNVKVFSILKGARFTLNTGEQLPMFGRLLTAAIQQQASGKLLSIDPAIRPLSTYPVH
jgi:hypothetical protein